MAPHAPGPCNARPLEMPVSILLPAALTCSRWELERRHMVPPSNDALRQIIERDADLVDSLNEFYGDAAADGGLDKVERELLLDLLGRHFTGQLWPRTGGMEATRRFMATLQRAMLAAGWKMDAFALSA